MSITKERKTEIINEFRRTESDTGSPEVQIAMLTHRINELTGHFSTHAKDHASRRGLLMLVSRRRRLLDYLRRHNQESYLSIIGRLSLRKERAASDVSPIHLQVHTVKVSVEREIGGRKLTLTTGEWAKQASGAVV